MINYLWAQRKVAYHIETEAQFGLIQSASATFKQTHINTFDGNRPANKLPVSILQQRMDAMEFSVDGAERPTGITFSKYLEGAPGILSASATPSTCHAADLMTVSMGGQSVNAGSGIVSATTSVLTVDDASFFPAGQMIAVLDSNGDAHPRCVIDCDTLNDELTLNAPLSFSPSSGSTCFNSHTVYLTTRVTGTLQLMEQFDNPGASRVFTGLQGPVAFNIGLGALVEATFTMDGADVVDASDDILVEEDYGTVSPLLFADSRIYLHDADTASAPTALAASETSFAPGYSFMPRQSPNGVNNLLAHVRVSSLPVAAGTLTAYYDDETLQNAWKNNTAQTYMLQVGTRNAMLVIYAGRCQIAEAPYADSDGQMAQSVSFSVDEDGRTVNESNEDLAKSAFKVAFFKLPA